MLISLYKDDYEPRDFLGNLKTQLEFFKIYNSKNFCSTEFSFFDSYFYYYLFSNSNFSYFFKENLRKIDNLIIRNIKIETLSLSFLI